MSGTIKTPRLMWKYTAVALAASAMLAVLIAVPTAIVSTPFFTRMTPVEPEQYVFWILTSVLTGALLATYLLPGLRSGASGPIGAGLLGTFAVGCPTCNQLVVALLETSGALTYFAPIQPLLGLAAVALPAVALWIRFRGLTQTDCPIPVAAAGVVSSL